MNDFIIIFSNYFLFINIIKSLSTDSFLEVSEEIEEKRFLLSFNENIEGDKQKWYFLSNEQDYYFIVSKNNSKCGIDVTDNRVKNNIRMQCYYPNGKYNQLFKLISIKQLNGGKFLALNFIIFLKNVNIYIINILY